MAAASVAPAAGLGEEVAALVRLPALVRVVVALLEGVADHVRHEALVPAHPAALRPVRGTPDLLVTAPWPRPRVWLWTGGGEGATCTWPWTSTSQDTSTSTGVITFTSVLLSV